MYSKKTPSLVTRISLVTRMLVGQIVHKIDKFTAPSYNPDQNHWDNLRTVNMDIQFLSVN